MIVYTSQGGVKYSFTDHALRRMALRRVSRQDVERTLDNFDSSDVDKQGNERFEKRYLGRKLRVVVAKNSNPKRVITVIVLV